MKVIHFINDLDGSGGAEQMILKVVPELEGEHIVVSMFDKGDIGLALESKGIKVYSLNIKHLNIFSKLYKFYKIIKKENPDILNTYLVPADIIGRFIGKLAGVKKVVCSVRNKFINRPYYLLADKLTYFLVDKYTPNSLSVEEFMLEVHRYKKHKIVTIPNCVDISRFMVCDNRASYKKQHNYEDYYLIGCISSFKKQKDHKTLIEAFAWLHTKCRCKLLLVGKGALMQDMKDLATKLGVEKDVVFLGVLPDIYYFITSIDLFILPSLHEGMSNALLEAMASSKPILASDIPENKELVTPFQDGLLFTPQDVHSLKEAMLSMYSNEKQAAVYGLNAKQKVEEKYSVANSIMLTNQLYKDLMEEK